MIMSLLDHVASMVLQGSPKESSFSGHCSSLGYSLILQRTASHGKWPVLGSFAVPGAQGDYSFATIIYFCIFDFEGKGNDSVVTP